MAAFSICCWSCGATVELDLSGNQHCPRCDAPLIIEWPEEQLNFVFPPKFKASLVASFKWLDPSILTMIKQAKKESKSCGA